MRTWENLLSLKEAAARLQVNRDTMTRYIKRGIIPAYRLTAFPTGRGRQEYRIKESDVEAYLKSRQV